jgi:hypothetical protein
LFEILDSFLLLIGLKHCIFEKKISRGPNYTLLRTKKGPRTGLWETLAYMIVIGTFGAVGNLAILLAFFTAPAKVSLAFLGVPCYLYAFLRN